MQDEPSVRRARDAYLRRNGLSLAGYHSRWVRLRLGPLPLGFPNFAARRRAVPLHDLHHVATGYATTWTGEAEISAWELAAGCGRFWGAWLLDLGGVVLGLVIAPRRTVRAWRSGRRCRSLYRELPGGLDDRVLDVPVTQLRRWLGLDSGPADAPRRAGP